MSFASAFLVSLLSLGLSIANCKADTITIFESPLAAVLSPVNYIEDTPVTAQARSTTQYSSSGVLMANVALVDLGRWHSTSGTNGIASISANGTIDYGSAVIFTFINPLNNAFPWVTDHSAISTDQFGGSLNTTILSAYDIAGNFLGSVSVVKTGPSMTLELQGLGKIHKAKGGSTLAIQRNRRLHMKPGTYILVSIGLLFLFWLDSHTKNQLPRCSRVFDI